MPLEGDIEHAAWKQAKARGWYTFKLNSRSGRGFPDRLFIHNNSGQPVIVFIEFKQPGRKPTKLQARRIEELKELGVNADWADSVKRAMEILDEALRIH